VDLGGKAIIECVASLSDDDIGKILMKCGMSVNKASPSTFGTLLASAFMEAGKGLTGKKEIDAKDIALAGRARLTVLKNEATQSLVRRHVGFPCPAVEATSRPWRTMRMLNGRRRDNCRGEKGMEDTKNMKAKHSRASYRPMVESVAGAGATAMYYLIEAFGKNLVTQIA